MIEIHNSVRAAIAVIALLCCAVSVRAGDTAEILVQVSLTAGLRYHDAKAVWDGLLHWRLQSSSPISIATGTASGTQASQ